MVKDIASAAASNIILEEIESSIEVKDILAPSEHHLGTIWKAKRIFMQREEESSNLLRL